MKSCLPYIPKLLIAFSLLIVNGGWAHWSSFNACDKSCGGGQQIITRLCNKPEPDFGGQKCLKSDGSGTRSLIDIQLQVCNIKACPGLLPSLCDKLLVIELYYVRPMYSVSSVSLLISLLVSSLVS